MSFLAFHIDADERDLKLCTAPWLSHGPSVRPPRVINQTRGADDRFNAFVDDIAQQDLTSVDSTAKVLQARDGAVVVHAVQIKAT
jgi:hypothetical protein